MRIILFLLLSAVIMVNCSSPVRSIEEVVAMDKEIHLGYDNPLDITVKAFAVDSVR